ncbi:TPA: hypothetical protein L6A27_06915 [Pseudomonas aeruginosa]|nr:hypothetical protein IPC434_12295 [Pseudomonas aeruginosa]HBP6037254.1 hypothetical protein [Pseudomonas aeruginosa]
MSVSACRAARRWTPSFGPSSQAKAVNASPTGLLAGRAGWSGAVVSLPPRGETWMSRSSRVLRAQSMSMFEETQSGTLGLSRVVMV